MLHFMDCIKILTVKGITLAFSERFLLFHDFPHAFRGIFLLRCRVASIPVFDIASSTSAISSSFSLALRVFVRLLNAIGVALPRFSLHLYETPCICMFFLQVFCKCQCLDCGTLCSNPLIFLKFH